MRLQCRELDGETDSDGCKNGSKKRCQICACSLRYRKIQDECQSRKKDSAVSDF